MVTTELAPTGSGSSNNKVTELYGYVIDYYMRTNAANANLMLQVEGAQRVYADGTNEATMGGGSYMTFTTNVSGYTTTQMKDLMKAIRVVFTTPGENGQAQILAVATLDIANADSAGNTVKAALKLCEYTTDGNVLKIVDANPATDAFDFKESQAITALTQNQAMKVSTMVYLDGDYVTNGMVANAQKSMTGKMNLQFATDTPLVPMEDTALRGDR